MSSHPVFETPPAQCAHIDCGYHAMAKVRTKTGYANFCVVHYRKFYQDRAEESCVRLGLLTEGQCREWLRNNKFRPKTFA